MSTARTTSAERRAQRIFDRIEQVGESSPGKLYYETEKGLEKEVPIKQWMRWMQAHVANPKLIITPKVKGLIYKLGNPEVMEPLLSKKEAKQMLDARRSDIEKYSFELLNPDLRESALEKLEKIGDEELPENLDTRSEVEWIAQGKAALRLVSNPPSAAVKRLSQKEKVEKLTKKKQELRASPPGPEVLEEREEREEEEKSPEPKVSTQAPSAASEKVFELYMREVEQFAKSGDAKKLVEFQTKAENAGLNAGEMNFLEKSINDLVKKRTLPKPNAELEYLLEREQLQKIQRAEKERLDQERLERSGQPQVEVDSIDFSDPRTGTGVVASIYNEDRELVDNPNLPINMQLNPPVPVLDTTPLVMAQNVMPLVDNQVSGTYVELEEKEDFVAVPSQSSAPNAAGVQVDIAAETQAEGGAVPDFGDAGAGAMPQVDIAAAASVASGSIDTDDSGFVTAQELGAVDQNPVPDTTQQQQLGVSIETTYTVKYHKAQTNEFFGSVEKPTWDMALNKTITLNYDNKFYEPTKETLLESMNQMISNKNLKVYKLATGIDSDVLDILTEYVIISQIHFCVLRNLQRGERTKTAMVPLRSLIDMRNQVAGVGGPAPGPDGLVNDFASAAGEQSAGPTQFQPTPTEPAGGIQTVDQLFPDARQDVLGKDITQKDIGLSWLNRNGRRDGQLFGKHYQSIKESRSRHSGGENFVFTGAAKGDLFNTYGDEKNMTKTSLRVSNVDLAPY